MVGAARFGGGGLGGGGVNPDQDAVRGGLGSGGAASSGVHAAPAALSVHRWTANAAPARAAVGWSSDGGGAGSSTERGSGGRASLGGGGGGGAGVGVAGLVGKWREGAGRVGGRGVGGEGGGFGEHTPRGRAYDSESQRNPGGSDTRVGTVVAQGGGANDGEGRNGPSDFDKICVICIESCADGCYDTHPGCTARNAFAHAPCFARVLINSYSKWCFDLPCCWLTKKNII